MTQIQFIHSGLQIGNSHMVINGILSLQVLLTPMIDADTIKKIQNLTIERGAEIAELSKARPTLRTYERRGEEDPKAVISQKRFQMELDKYQLLLDFAKSKDLLIAEVETEDFL